MLKSIRIKNKVWDIVCYIFPVFFFLFISLIFFKKILSSDGIVVGNDWMLPFNTDQMVTYIRHCFFTWTYDMNLFGIKNPFFVQMPFVILAKIFIIFGLSGEALSKSLIIGIYTLSGVSIFAYLRFLKLRYLTSLVGGFIWITMPFFFNYTIMGWMFVIFSIGTILPITLIAFTKSVRDHNISYSIIAGLLYSIAILQSQSLIWYPMVLIAMSFTLINDKKTFYQYIKSFTIVMLIGLSLHLSWWPSLFINNDKGVMNSDLALDAISQGMRARLNLPNILRGWGSLFNQPYETGYAKMLLPLSFLIPIMAIGSILQDLSYRKGLKISMALIFLYMFLLFSISPEIMSKIPLSNLVRDTARFTVLSSFALTVLSSLFIDYLIVKKKGRWIIIMLIILVIINSYSFILGGLTQPALNTYDERLRTYQFPDEYTTTEKYLASIPVDSKSYYPPSGTNISIKKDPKFNGDFKEIKDPFRGYSSMPGTIYMYYSSMGKPDKISFLLESLFNNEISKDSLSLLGMMNIGYIINRDDTVYKHAQSQNLKKLTESVGEENISTFGSVHIIKNNYFLPHFYVPQKTIYLQNKINSIQNVLSLNDYNPRSAIYLTKDKHTDYIEHLPEPNTIISEAIPVKKINSEFIDRDRLLFPTVNNEPNTLKWYFSQINEKYYITRAKNKPLNKADILIWSASKRIAEIIKYKPTKIIEANLIRDYNKKAKEAIDILQDGYDSQTTEDRVLTEEYIEMSKKILSYMSKSIYLLNENGYNFLSSENPNTIYNDFYAYLDKIAHLSCKENCYVISVPEDGEYEILINKKDIDEIDKNWQISLKIQYEDNQKTYIQSNTENTERVESNWYKVGESYLTKGYNHTANIVLNETKNLLDDQDWKNAANTDDSTPNNLKLSSQSMLPGYTENKDQTKMTNNHDPKGSYILWNNDIVYKQIPNLELSKKYKLSFDYNIDRGDLGVTVIEDILDYETAYQTYNFDWESFEKNELLFPIKTKNLMNTRITQTNDYIKQSEETTNLDFKKKCTIEDNKCFLHFESEIESNNPSINTFLYLYSIPQKNQRSTVDVKNIKMQKVINPRLIVRKVIGDNKSSIETSIPKIKFIKINPTKYKILVSGAKDPYTLIFSESFHEGWGIYNITNNSINENKNILLKYLGILGKFITTFFIKDSGYGKEVANYYNGDITEGTHRNTFIEPSTFDTWGKKTIADNNHFQVNGYANAWQISPSDTNNEKNYELIVEFKPQRLFYIGLTLSSIIFVLLIKYLVYILLMKIIGKQIQHKKNGDQKTLSNFIVKHTLPLTISKSATNIINNYDRFIILKANYVKIIFLIAIILQLFIVSQNILAQTIILFILWIHLVKIMRLNNNLIGKLTFASLIIIPLLLIINQTILAEKIALWTFIFLMTMLIEQIYYYIKQQGFTNE